MITRYGYTTIFAVFLISGAIIGISFLTNNSFLKTILIAAAVLFFFFTLSFFRDPDRTAPDKDNIVVSPADGTVLFVKDVEENKFLHAKGKQVSIFMSPLNVHVNRIPITGRVDYLNYIHGEYLVASSDKASEQNERCETGISSANGKVLFTQVSGYVARRIVNELKTGQDVKIGERFGMIKFGSRVDVIVPSDWKADVKKGDKVTAGETILFEAIKQ
jgi:phosphatidylserine decarboxylase